MKRIIVQVVEGTYRYDDVTKTRELQRGRGGSLKAPHLDSINIRNSLFCLFKNIKIVHKLIIGKRQELHSTLLMYMTLVV